MKLDKNKKYYFSAVECMTEDGEMCLSLCRGQGGTPADVPMRQWSDSWQVVAMATYSELVLMETVPFVAKDFPEYSCTGFRLVLCTAPLVKAMDIKLEEFYCQF